MLVYEAKLEGTQEQYGKLDQAIRTAQFVRNKCLRYWIDHKGAQISQHGLTKVSTQLRKEFEWCKKLSAQAGQASAERAWQAIARFYKNCREGIKPFGFPKFKKNCRSVEYKQDGWKLSEDRSTITFTDGFKAGTFKLWTSRDLMHYSKAQIKRVRVVKRADGYYAQFCINIERKQSHEFSDRVIGIDLGLEYFISTSDGQQVEPPKFLRQSEQALKKAQRKVSRRKKGSQNRKKAINRLGRKHLKISRQRQDWACKLAQCVIESHDLVVYEDLKIRNLVRNHHLAKSISDAAWYQFTQWLEYFAKISAVPIVAIPPHFTSQDCPQCGHRCQKTLSTRTHRCSSCGHEEHRDTAAAKVILSRGLEFLGEIVPRGTGNRELEIA